MATMKPLSGAGMNVQVSGKHIDVGMALRTRMTDELVAAVGKYFERGGSAEVVVSKEGQGAIGVEVRALLPTGQQLIARSNGGDAHAAFDGALAKIVARIRRYKGRLVDHHAHGQGERAAYTVLRAPDEDDDFQGDDDWGRDGSAGAGAPAAAIIAETEAQVRTLTVSGAVMELDLTEAPVVVFRNAAHGGFSVVYRRADGNIGWIDPQRAQAASPKPARIPA